MRYLKKENFIKLLQIYKRYKPLDLLYKILERLLTPYQDYQQHLEEYLPSPEELEEQRRTQENFRQKPLISIVVPTYETEALFLRQMIDSCAAQTYPVWQLCIADGSHSDKVEKVITGEYGAESRITYQRLEKNAGIAENTNRGFALAKGAYIGLLDHDDLLVPSALYEMVKRINETGADFLYSDEDKVSADLKQYQGPHFKLDFNQELLYGNNYICHFLMVSREVLEKTGGLDSRYDGAQDFDFVLRCSECAERIEHIPKILYHWRIHSGSTAGNTDSKLYAYEAGKRAVQDMLKRKGWKGQVVMDDDLGFYRIRYQVPSHITVGIGVWGKASGGFERVEKQIRQELEREHIRVVWEGEWEPDPGKAADPETVSGQWSFPAAAAESKPDYMILLHRAVKKAAADSVLRLIGSCAREGIQMTGCRTLHHGRVRQCGYWRKEGGPEPRFKGLPGHFKGYFRRACLAVQVDEISSDLAVLAVDSGINDKKVVVPDAEVRI